MVCLTTVQDADAGDTTTMVETLITAAEQVEAVLPAAAGITEVVGDKGYHSNDTMVAFADLGIRSYVSEPDRGRRNWKGKAAAREAVYANRRRIRGPRGQRLLRQRGERLERPNAHLYETGRMRRVHLRGQPKRAALVPANKKRIRDIPRYTEIYRDMPGYSGMRPRRLRPMIVGVPLEPGVGGMGGEYDIDAEGGDGGGPDPIGDGVVADGAGFDAASPAGVCGVKAFGDLLGEGPGIGPAGGVVADLGGDLARHRP